MLNFENRVGPVFADPPTYSAHHVPDWFRDAKLGFFVHWGIYTVPAWAVTDVESVPTEDAYAQHLYAEWYGNTVRIPSSPTRQRHEATYGVGVSYEDLADRWDAGAFDADEFVGTLAAAGGRYLVPTTKHHDGFCLWDTATTTFNAARRGPRRDLVAELHAAAHAAGMRYGVYFSGALDWHVGDFPPIESDTDLFRFRRNDPTFARYAATQLEELVDRFRPDILWNDIEWPDGGKDRSSFALAALFDRYFTQVPTGVVNDRWGVPYHGFLTREYSFVEDILPEPWEATRGLGRSFGYNQAESERESLSGVELVRLLVDVVSKNGNLLLNVGPTMDGRIPEVQRIALSVLGDWIRANGRAIYGTRPWIRCGDRPAGSAPVAFTTAADVVYIHALDPSSGRIVLPAELEGRIPRWLGAGTDETDPLRIPDLLRGAPVAVAAVGP